jgi:hypothetical protein
MRSVRELRGGSSAAMGRERSVGGRKEQKLTYKI